VKGQNNKRMQLIDTHVHFWSLANKINSWVLKASNLNLQKDYYVLSFF
jgi:predicted TIM-barrel fold metal-dependent hydrolase